MESPENILVDINMVDKPHCKTQQDSGVVVQMIEEEVDCFFDDITEPGPISALNNSKLKKHKFLSRNQP